MNRAGLILRFLPRVEVLETRTLPAFLPGVPYTVGPYPQGPDVADFNQDGYLDVAVATGFVSVFLGNGDGTLSPYQSLAARDPASSVKAADMNNDGIPDIAAATGKSVSVHLSNGDGTFGLPLIARLPYHVYDVVARDFNGDGFQDVAAVSYSDDCVGLFLGNGDGTLGHVATLATGYYPIEIDAADFNNDGAVDIAVANQDFPSIASFSVLLGNGNGTFKPKVDYLTGHVFADGITVADFDNDGIFDVVVSNPLKNSISKFDGIGDGTFESPVSYRVRSFPVGMTPADFNHDGFLDLAISCGTYPTGAVTVLLNNQTGGFVTDSVHPTPQTLSIVSGDLNGDGYFDLMAASGEFSRLTVFLNDGLWGPPTPIIQTLKHGFLPVLTQPIRLPSQEHQLLLANVTNIGSERGSARRLHSKLVEGDVVAESFNLCAIFATSPCLDFLRMSNVYGELPSIRQPHFSRVEVRS